MHDFSSPLLAHSLSHSRPPHQGFGPLAQTPAIVAPLDYPILALILLFTSALGGWQWFRSQQKIKQLRRENRQQSEQLDQAQFSLQEYLDSPDLKGAKILALDYLRMRLDEEVFRYQIIHQVQEKLTQLISELVKSTLPETPSNKRILLDRLIEIEYDLEGLEEKWYRCTVLRIHLQLRQLPLQSSSHTVQQMVEAITLFLNHPQGQSETRTPLQEQWLGLSWESSHQPLPLLNLQNYPAKTKDIPAAPSPYFPPLVPTTESSPPRRPESLASFAP